MKTLGLYLLLIFIALQLWSAQLRAACQTARILRLNVFIAYAVIDHADPEITLPYEAEAEVACERQLRLDPFRGL